MFGDNNVVISNLTEMLMMACPLEPSLSRSRCGCGGGWEFGECDEGSYGGIET
ncbi:hypothetical protein TSUD_77460 [Trifolium subterraneum]|uniref:Uncharacterized protein n=1 Tax=Trifolium subterraneum TaxID=3900 RepID=A0A2Z6LN51_TRISU|nr:hypothetical protein TSUD_77460 [Trifolium subterraneum]